MEFDNSFEVPLPPRDAWKVLMDVPRIAPCLPGAQLTEVVDEKTYKGKVSVKLGPVALTFAGTTQFEEIDEAGMKANLKANGNDQKGRGGANAKVNFHLEEAGSGTKVMVHTNLTLSGSVAQYGRAAGMIQGMAEALIGQFASSLKAQLAAESAAAPAPAPEPVPAPVAAAAPASGVTAAPAPAAAPAAPPPPRSAAPPPPPAAASLGFGLILKMLWAGIKGFFSKR